MTQATHKKAFTLIEVLVVVLIIAVLTAVAVPMYKRAVLKSRFSTVMPMAKAVADAQEVYYLGNGQYALGKEELDITPMNVENTEVALSTAEEDEKYNYVAAKRTDFPSARYIIYQKNSPMFADNIHCEAADTEAEWLCEKGLGGTEIPGSVNTGTGNYKTFLLSGTMGATDKLPSSLAKLAASLCEGKTNCTATVQDNEVIVSECGTITYVPGVGNNMKGCVKTKYNDEGTSTDKTYAVCTSSHHEGKCYPIRFSHEYERIYSATGVRIAYKEGLSTPDQNGNVRAVAVYTSCTITQCSSGQTWKREDYRCPEGQFLNLETFACEAY